MGDSRGKAEKGLKYGKEKQAALFDPECPAQSLKSKIIMNIIMLITAAAN